jgi:DNA-binding protein YbaB
MFGKLGDMASMAGKVKEMKDNVTNAQKAILAIQETVDKNGITVVVNGNHMVEDISISYTHANDLETLEDVLISNMNEANQNIINKSAKLMSEASGGLDLNNLLG